MTAMSKAVPCAVAAAAAAAAAAALYVRRAKLQRKQEEEEAAKVAADPANKRVCIIGAGPAGLSTLRAFDSLRMKGIAVPELVCYDKQSDWGGLWFYDWRTGVDMNGHPVHTSMYKYLWSNAPKECLEFADYSFEEHFGKAIPSYPSRPVLFDYITGRAEKRCLKEFIQFNTSVESVEFDSVTQKFSVTTVAAQPQDPANPRSNVTWNKTTEIFDYVVCASGHYSFPNFPHFEGIESFKGRVFHSHDLRDATEFKGQEVLIVGTSYSAEDIASQLWKYGAKHVAISHRTKPIGYTTWPKEITEVPLLTKVEDNLCTFADGSTKHFDAIMLCTGYLHHFPFLSDELRLNPHNNKLQPSNKIWLQNLYQGIFHMPNPKMIHIGPHTGFFTMGLFDAQAHVARDVVMGRLALPDAAGMAEHDRMMCEKCRRLEDVSADTMKYNEACINFQGDYFKDLISLTDHPSYDVDGAKTRFFEWEQDKQVDIMGFRDNSYKSIVTGKMSAELTDKDGKRLLWKDALSDSCESFNMPDLFRGNDRISKLELKKLVGSESSSSSTNDADSASNSSRNI